MFPEVKVIKCSVGIKSIHVSYASLFLKRRLIHENIELSLMMNSNMKWSLYLNTRGLLFTLRQHLKYHEQEKKDRRKEKVHEFLLDDEETFLKVENERERERNKEGDIMTFDYAAINSTLGMVSKSQLHCESEGAGLLHSNTSSSTTAISSSNSSLWMWEEKKSNYQCVHVCLCP